MGRFDYEEHGPWDYTRLRWYTFRSVQDLLKRHGFVLEYSGASGALPFGRVMNRSLDPGMSARISQRLWNVLPGLFGGQLLFAA